MTAVEPSPRVLQLKLFEVFLIKSTILLHPKKKKKVYHSSSN